jgi:hypothetical protein
MRLLKLLWQLLRLLPAEPLDSSPVAWPASLPPMDGTPGLAARAERVRRRCLRRFVRRYDGLPLTATQRSNAVTVWELIASETDPRFWLQFACDDAELHFVLSKLLKRRH